MEIPESVRRVMAEEINQPANRGYADNGIIEFKETVQVLLIAALFDTFFAAEHRSNLNVLAPQQRTQHDR